MAAGIGHDPLEWAIQLQGDRRRVQQCLPLVHLSGGAVTHADWDWPPRGLALVARRQAKLLLTQRQSARRRVVHGDQRIAGLEDPGVHHAPHRGVRHGFDGIPQIVGLGVGILIPGEVLANAVAKGGGAQVLLQHPQHCRAFLVGEEIKHAIGVLRRLHRVFDRAGGVERVHLERRGACQAKLRPPLPGRLKGIGSHGGHKRGKGFIEPDAVPPLHGHEVAEPHMSDFVRNHIRDPHELGLRRLLRVHEEQHFAKGDAAEIFHGAKGEIRNGHQVQLLAGVG